MIQSFHTRFLILVIFLLTSYQMKAQQTVFTEDFTTPQGTTYTTSGTIGSSRWTVARSGQDFGARISGGLLTLTNDATSASNPGGWVSATTSTSNFDDTYNPILSQNAGIVSWTFNMRQIRSNPRGFEFGQYGVAFILAGTPGSNVSTGKGWALQLGNSLTTDPIRLVAYSNGLKTFSTKLSSKASGFTDFGREYTSVRVEYNPSDNRWTLYLRKDGSTFQNPKSGTLIFQETWIHSDFVNEPLTIIGGYWSAGTARNQTAFFDNISVSVQKPEIISINPDSKIAGSAAFTMTVNGSGFLPSSKVQWNGQDRPTTYVSATQIKAAIPASDLVLSGTANVQVKNNAVLSNTIIFDIEPSGAPTLTLSKNSLPTFNTTQGTAPTKDTYTISGNNLQSGATLTAPSQFEMSVGTSTSYSNPLVLPNTGGGLTGQPLTINVRVKATASAGVYSSTISNSATGAVTKLVAVSAKVLALEPTTAATAVNFSNITSTSMTVNWTNGNGSERIVLIKQASTVNALPIDGTTYNANAAFGMGNEIGTGNFVIYKGSGSSVTVNGLNPATNYHVSVVEFNGPANAENYSNAGATSSQLTLNSPAGLQVKVANTSYKIDFDSTVDGVNLGDFQGTGIAKIAEPGQLDSDSWAFTGFANGNINFGGESPEDSSYENGVSDGDVDETGIYAFNVSETAENYTLGIKPGGADFNPGTITLRLHNRTSAAITSLNIGYKVYIKNVENSSTKVSFSHKLETATSFSGDVTIVDVVSEAAADLNPGWKAYYRVVTLTGLNIPADKYYNLRWSGSTAIATAAQDEFGIDDIEVIANPTTNVVAFDGIAEDFVLAGNANLSADLSVQNRLLFSGGKLAIKDRTLTIAGTVVNTTLQGITGGTDSKLIISGTQNRQISFDQTNAGTTNALQSFSLLGTTAKKISVLSNVTVNQLLKNDGLQILDLGTNILSGSLTSIQNNGTILTQNTDATPFPAGKTWGGTGILKLNATSTAQTLVAGTYNNLTLLSTGGTAANADITVNGTLDLPAANPNATTGSLSMSSYTLTMGSDGTNTGIGDVTGIIKRDSFLSNKLYTFGHPNTSITFPPNAPGGTLPSTMSIKLSIGSGVTWKPTPVLRSVDIIQTGGTLTKAIIRQHYLDTELNGNIESKLVFWGKAISAAEFEQGRSSINTDLNWVEITNANVGQYFTGTFGQVTIILDQTEVAGVVWNGSVSDSWTTAANWTPAAKPSSTSTVIIPDANTTANDPELNTSELIGSLTIEAGGIVKSTGTLTDPTTQLFLSSGAGAWQNNGIFVPGASTVTFNNIDATISGTTNFNNLTIASGAGLRALEGNYMSIAGALTNEGTMFTTLIANTIEFKGNNQVIPDVNGESFGGYHNLIVSGTETTLAPSIATLNLRGNLTLNNPLSFVGKTVNLGGISNQTIGGSAAIDFNDLIVNKETGAVILAKNITVGGTLTLTKGNVILGANNLTLGQNAVAGTFTVNNMIVADGSGLVLRPFTSIGEYFFPIGELTSNPAYSPIKVKITSGTFSNAFVGVSVVDAIHPNNYSSQNYISRYWNVKQTGITNAKADITANYVQAEVLVPENKLAAGQLDGTFNITTNPWKKVGTLANLTLSAADVTLTPDQNSVFTGIKGGDFTVEVYGYGEFCQGSSVTMNAVNSGGDAPYTYLWSPILPNAAVVTIPTATVGSTNYQLTVTDANGFVAIDNNSPVEILPASVGGIIENADQQICAGTLAADLNLNGSVGSVLHWQRSLTSSFTEYEEIFNSTTNLSGSEIGSLYETTYFRAVVQNGRCESISNIAEIAIKSTTWNGTDAGWSNGVPTATTSVIIAADYSTSNGVITACSCEVNSGALLTISADTSMTIQNEIINNGNVIVESDGNLIQVNPNAANVGNITVKRELKFSEERHQYNYLISPVKNISLLTIYRDAMGNSTVPSVLYHNEANNKFYNSTGAYIAGRALAVKEATQSAFPGGVGKIMSATFTGEPMNGTLDYTLINSLPANPNRGYNLIGNPYPSNLDLNAFYAANSENLSPTFNFWDSTANSETTQLGDNYLGQAYAQWNAATPPQEGSGTTATGDLEGTKEPNQYVKVGQGFMARSLISSKSITFTNTMRSAGASEGFFGKTVIPFDRYWLNMTSPSNITAQIAVVYFAGGNNAYTKDDSRSLLGADAIYSMVDGQAISINGKNTFSKTDLVALGMNHFTNGNYTISLGEKLNGVFANGQNIYLKDKQTGTLTNLSQGNYTFMANTSGNTGRFEIVYQCDIVLVTDSKVKDGIVVYRDHDDFVIKSPKVMSMIQVYDVSGRLVKVLHPHNKQSSLNAAGIPSGMYVLKIITIDGEVINKKISR